MKKFLSLYINKCEREDVTYKTFLTMKFEQDDCIQIDSEQLATHSTIPRPSTRDSTQHSIIGEMQCPWNPSLCFMTGAKSNRRC